MCAATIFVLLVGGIRWLLGRQLVGGQFPMSGNRPAAPGAAAASAPGPRTDVDPWSDPSAGDARPTPMPRGPRTSPGRGRATTPGGARAPARGARPARPATHATTVIRGAIPRPGPASAGAAAADQERSARRSRAYLPASSGQADLAG